MRVPALRRAAARSFQDAEILPSKSERGKTQMERRGEDFEGLLRFRRWDSGEECQRR
jgi:hypothetical protein